MKKKMLTEREAWLLAAKLWEKPKMCKTNGCISRIGDLYVPMKNRLIVSFGLCWVVRGLTEEETISDEVEDAMLAKIDAVVQGSDHYPYAWNKRKTGARQRVAFCKRMVRNIDKEEKDARA